MPENLVYNCNYYMEGFPSCCSVDTPVRLRSNVASKRDVERDLRETAQRGRLSHYEDLKTRDWITRCGLQNIVKNHSGPPRSAIPVEVAFAGVLDDLLTMGHAMMFVMTDNMTVRGDVHRGPFSTKNFCKWLEDNELANVISMRNGRMKTWVFHFTGTRRLARGAVNRAITQYMRIMRQRRKEIERQMTARGVEIQTTAYSLGEDTDQLNREWNEFTMEEY